MNKTTDSFKRLQAIINVQGKNPMTGKRDVVEIKSPSQKSSFMNKKKEKIMDALGDEAGDVSWKEY